MNYNVEKGEKSTVKITITLDNAEWESANQQAYNKNKGKYSYPGFRKGNVPRKVLEQAYGKGVFFEEAINVAFPKYYGEVLDKETELKVIDQPEIDVQNISEEGITLVAITPVKPEVTLGKYKGIKIAKVEYNVTDEDVEKEVAKLQERNSRLVEVTDRPAAMGDTTVIDYSGSVDGVKFPGGTAEKQNLVLGSGSFIPGFEEGVVGMNIGDEKDVAVKFPEDYHAEELKGKDAVFAIKLHEIKVKELPEVNDEFIKDAVGVETLEQYKTETKAKLEKEASARADAELEDNILKKIADKSETEVPDCLIERQIDNIMQDIEYRLMYQGMKLADYVKYIGSTMEEFRNNYRAQAEVNVKYQLVIDKIVEVEKISCTDEELDARIKELAEQGKKDYEEFKKNMSDRQKDYLKDGLVIKNLFAFLKSVVKIG